MNSDPRNPWLSQGSPLPPPNFGGQWPPEPQPSQSVPYRPVGEPGGGFPAPDPNRPTSRRRVRQAAFAGGLVGAFVAAGVSVATVKLTEHSTTRVVTEAAPITTSAAVKNSNPVAAAGSTLAKDPTSGALELHALIAKVGPSVVAIEVGQRDASGTVQAIAAGSGVIISSDGLVLTNAHVVTVTDQMGRTIADPVFTLKMSDGTVREAKVLGTAPDYDVALMRLTDTSNLTPVTLGSSSDLRVGDDVVAIGNALDLGDSPTVSKGIVSALDRSLQESDALTLHGLIQTDAPINHGNSGGALVNAKGQLVGINSAGIPDAQNIGFAIAIDTIKPLLEDLKAGRTPTASPTAFLGVTVSQTPEGVAITDVTEGGGAARGGIQPGDIIKRIGDTDVSTLEQLGALLRSLKPGTTTAVQVIRNGATVDLTVQLGTRTN